MRLDLYLAQKGFYNSRAKATQAIKRGEVTVNGAIELKPAVEISGFANIEIRAEKTFVSLGGYKLDKAFEDFSLDCSGKIFADLGASTGGFTDVLLSRGAKKIYCVDVGSGLLDKKIAQNKRVVDMSGVNARYLRAEDFRDRLDGVVIDCSFISLKLILPTAVSIVKKEGYIVALIKPQFECGEKNLSKSGIVLGKDRQLSVVGDIYDFCVFNGWGVKDITNAPKKKKKNIEYLLLISPIGDSISKSEVLKKVEIACDLKGEL